MHKYVSLNYEFNNSIRLLECTNMYAYDLMCLTIWKEQILSHTTHHLSMEYINKYSQFMDIYPHLGST